MDALQAELGVEGERRLERRADAVPASVPGLRHAAVAFAVACGADPDAQAAVALAVTEATTNAVVHAYVGRDPGRLHVVGEPADDALVFRVVDDGRGMQPRHDSPGLGLGLPLIATVSERFDTKTAPGEGTRLCVWFRMDPTAATLPS